MAGHHRWGARSQEALATVRPELRAVCDRALAVSPFDLTVTCGKRSREDQEKAVREGRSKVHWPHGKHNVENDEDLARAVDIHPYPVNFRDTARYLVLNGIMLACAAELGVKLRLGTNWDGDGEFLTDQRFDDYPHHELVD